MSYYIGKECLICKEKIGENDEVVVCPECGTPYHKKCYKEKNACINYELHESGGSWIANEKKVEKTDSSNKKICPECSFLNAEDADICENCKCDLSDKECKNIDISSANVIKIDLENDYYGMNAFEVMDEQTGITLGEMADYVKNNRFFYMVVFKKLKDTGRNFSVNLSAFLFPEYYSASRKMFGCTAILLILNFILNIPSTLVTFADSGYGGKAFVEFVENHMPSNTILNLLFAIYVAVRVVFGFAANGIYFRHVISKLSKIKEESPDYLKYRIKIKNAGGLSASSLLITILVETLLLAILFFAVMFIAYQ